MNDPLMCRMVVTKEFILEELSMRVGSSLEPFYLPCSRLS